MRKKYLISHNTFVFLYLGRINKDKGIKDLLVGIRKISWSHDAMLIMVGSLEDKTFINEFKTKKSVAFLLKT